MPYTWSYSALKEQPKRFLEVAQDLRCHTPLTTTTTRIPDVIGAPQDRYALHTGPIQHGWNNITASWRWLEPYALRCHTPLTTTTTGIPDAIGALKVGMPYTWSNSALMEQQRYCLEVARNLRCHTPLITTRTGIPDVKGTPHIFRKT